MTVYRFDDPVNKIEDFGFYSTTPPVFVIVVCPREGFNGAFAEAMFRRGHEPGLNSVTAWGETEEEALEALLDALRTHFTETKEEGHESESR